MKEPKYYRVHICYHHEQARNPYQYQEFVCITTADRVEKIFSLYSDLWLEIIDALPTNAEGQYYSSEELTESKIVQEWEGFDFDALLEDIETGEKFWYVATRVDGVDGYELEPVGEAV